MDMSMLGSHKDDKMKTKQKLNVFQKNQNFFTKFFFQ